MSGIYEVSETVKLVCGTLASLYVTAASSSSLWASLATKLNRLNIAALQSRLANAGLLLNGELVKKKKFKRNRFLK